MDNIINEILQELFDNYLANGAELVNLYEIIESKSGDPDAVIANLVDMGFIRNRQHYRAAISVDGITEINPNYFSQCANKVVEHAKSNGGYTTVVTAFGVTGFMVASDIGNYIKNNKERYIGVTVQSEGSNDVRIFIR